MLRAPLATKIKWLICYWCCKWKVKRRVKWKRCHRAGELEWIVYLHLPLGSRNVVCLIINIYFVRQRSIASLVFVKAKHSLAIFFVKSTENKCVCVLIDLCNSCLPANCYVFVNSIIIDLLWMKSFCNGVKYHRFDECRRPLCQIYSVAMPLLMSSKFEPRTGRKWPEIIYIRRIDFSEFVWDNDCVALFLLLFLDESAGASVM